VGAGTVPIGREVAVAKFYLVQRACTNMLSAGRISVPYHIIPVLVPEYEQVESPPVVRCCLSTNFTILYRSRFHLHA
jgi:hypothetical protein